MRTVLFILTFATSLFVSDIACAHIDHGGMPDSVAEMEYRILLEFEPQKHDIRNKLGDVLLRLKKYEEARVEFLAILDVVPDNLEAQIGLGQLLIHEQKWAEAEDCFLKLQKHYPANIELSYYLGIIYKGFGDLEKAQRILNEALLKAEKDQSQASAHIVGKIKEVLADFKVQSGISADKVRQ
mgnify:CR=1 FL=1